MRTLPSSLAITLVLLLSVVTSVRAEPGATDGASFLERRIRPILVAHCYECHSEKAKEQQGGLLLDRQSGWLKGGDTEKAVVPGNVEASLLGKAVRYLDEDLQMPPVGQLESEQISTF